MRTFLFGVTFADSKRTIGRAIERFEDFPTGAEIESVEDALKKHYKSEATIFSISEIKDAGPLENKFD